jgi:heme/copper-type cytochrome/quinol oxidase subunit 2
MPAFAKNPKFIGSVILILWLAYVIYENFQLAAISIKLFPGLELNFRVSAVMIASAIFGAVITLIIQFFWRRRSSKNASPAAGASAKTTA